MEWLVRSPSTMDPARARYLRYRVKRKIDGAVNDLILIMDGNDPRLAGYAAKCIRDSLLGKVGAEVADAADER